jgi:nucleoid-associated protein YgaU/nucleoid DNA-binding protein
MEGKMSNATVSQKKNLLEQAMLEPLAQMGGVTTAFMRKFVRETIALIEAGLWRDGIVKIHNFGTFRLAETTGTPQVVFQPAKNIRASVIRAFGPAVHTGSRVSLPALLEKHLGAFSPPEPAGAFEPPAVEKRVEAESAVEAFDIAEVLPDLPDDWPPRFAFAQTAAEATEPTLTAEVESPVHDLPSNGAAPRLTLDEPAEEVAPVVSQSNSESDRFFQQPVVSSRKKRLAWYAGAVAALALLLLLLLPGRIAEKSELASESAASRPTAMTTTSDSSDQITNGHSPSSLRSQAPAKPPPFFAGGMHRVVPEDNLWKVSGNYYRQHYLWPHIYRANIAAIKNPNILERDQQLAVPILYGPPEQLTAVDRRNLAEGYFLLYRYYRANEPALAPFALWAAVRYEARIKTEYAAELRDDDLAFLEAHTVVRQIVER